MCASVHGTSYSLKNVTTTGKMRNNTARIKRELAGSVLTLFRLQLENGCVPLFLITPDLTPAREPRKLVGESAGLMIERLRVRIPAGAAGENFFLQS